MRIILKDLKTKERSSDENVSNRRMKHSNEEVFESFLAREKVTSSSSYGLYRKEKNYLAPLVVRLTREVTSDNLGSLYITILFTLNL